MLNFIKKLFGNKEIDFLALSREGAQIVDVRTPTEFAGGNIQGSLNIPLQHLEQQLGNIDKTRPVITCCASGMRSASAKAILKSKGYKAYNGGGWKQLQKKLSKK